MNECNVNVMMAVFGRIFVYLWMVFIFTLRTQKFLEDRQLKRLENVIWAIKWIIECSFIENNSTNVHELISYLADRCIQLGGVHSVAEHRTVMNLRKYYAPPSTILKCTYTKMHFLLSSHPEWICASICVCI